MCRLADLGAVAFCLARLAALWVLFLLAGCVMGFVLWLIGGKRAALWLLCACVAIAWGGWHRHTSASLAHALALSEARVAVLEAQRDAAAELAADYQARAERAVADKILADQAARQAAAVRARKWSEIRERERAWSETPVPAAVVEGLR